MFLCQCPLSVSSWGATGSLWDWDMGCVEASLWNHLHSSHISKLCHYPAGVASAPSWMKVHLSKHSSGLLCNEFRSFLLFIITPFSWKTDKNNAPHCYIIWMFDIFSRVFWVISVKIFQVSQFPWLISCHYKNMLITLQHFLNFV